MGIFSRTPRRQGVVTASAVRIEPNSSPPNIAAAAAQRQLLQGWQYQSFGYYNTIGEVWFASQFYARGLQNLRLYVGRKDPSSNEVEEIDDPGAGEILDDMQDPGGGRAGLLGSYGQLMWLIGEGYMLVTPPTDNEAQRNNWEFVSPSELTVLAGTTLLRQQSPGLPQKQIRYVQDGTFDPQAEGTGVCYRYWRRHPQFSAQADAPMRGVLLLCDELERLTAAVRSRAVSRLAGPGLLLVPDEISQPPPEPVGDEDPEVDIFVKSLTDAIIAPLNDPGSASAQSPIVIRGAAEYLKELRHLQIHDPTQTYPEEGLRTELIRRIAISSDFPPEILTGLSDTNHWNGWAISEETWRSHLQPVAQRFCEDVTSSYFRPACRDAGVAGWEDLVVWYDAAAVINHPDRGKDAQDLYAARAISKAAYRDAKNFSDDDAMPQDELDEAIGVAVHDASMAKYGIPGLRSGGIEPSAGVVESGGGTTAPGSPPAISGSETEKAPPANPAGEGDVTASAARLQGAAELTLDRCRELAGSRLRTKITRSPVEDRCVECGDLIRDVPNALVASALGSSAAGLELPTPRELVAGGAAGFRERAIAWGVDSDRAALMSEQIEQHAARTLFEADPAGMPKGFGR